MGPAAMMNPMGFVIGGFVLSIGGMIGMNRMEYS